MAVVLVTDGEQRAALATVRSLGRAGHQVIVVSSRPSSLAGASRFCCAELRLPDPLRSPDAYSTELERVTRERKVDVLIPISEASLLAVLPARDRFGATIPFANDGRFNRICNKAEVMAAARALGIGIPAQVRIESHVELECLHADALSFPLVLKPARSVVTVGGERIKSAVLYVSNGAELQAALARLPDGAYPVLLQERIIGPGVGVFALLWKGETIASFFHRRLREKPPSGGVSVYRESIAPDAELLRLSVALLDSFDWEGVAMVEYKIDERTGRPFLMEINGRFWGSLQLAVDAGVDFPRLLTELALGGRPRPVHEYRWGVRSRWWWGDVDHLFARLRKSPIELALPPGAPGRTRTLLDFIAASGSDSRNEVLRISDPRPAVRETIDWLQRR